MLPSPRRGVFCTANARTTIVSALLGIPFQPPPKDAFQERFVDIEVRRFEPRQNVRDVYEAGVGTGAKDTQRPGHAESSLPGFCASCSLVDQQELCMDSLR